MACPVVRAFGRKRWGDEGYAMEEFVAELGAAFVSADLALTPEVRDDHASYIASWLKVLKRQHGCLPAVLPTGACLSSSSGSVHSAVGSGHRLYPCARRCMLLSGTTLSCRTRPIFLPADISAGSCPTTKPIPLIAGSALSCAAPTLLVSQYASGVTKG
jgi:hypothetical protein